MYLTLQDGSTLSARPFLIMSSSITAIGQKTGKILVILTVHNFPRQIEENGRDFNLIKSKSFESALFFQLIQSIALGKLYLSAFGSMTIGWFVWPEIPENRRRVPAPYFRYLHGLWNFFAAKRFSGSRSTQKTLHRAFKELSNGVHVNKIN